MGWPGPMTHRQFAVWQTWLNQQWNVKDKVTYYLMQIAAEARRGVVRHPNKVKVDDLFIPFTTQRDARSKPKLTREQAAQQAQKRWMGFFGAANVKVVRKGADGNLYYADGTLYREVKS